MDVFDIATDLEIRTREQALAAQRQKAACTPKLKRVGYCHNPRCEKEFPRDSQRLFCGPACAREFSRFTTRQ